MRVQADEVPREGDKRMQWLDEAVMTTETRKMGRYHITNNGWTVLE